MCEHAVVRTPRVANMSLTPSGRPASGPPSPFASAASARRAISWACPGVSSTKALSAWACPTAATWALVSSAAENSRLRRRSRACARVSEVSSLILRARLHATQPTATARAPDRASRLRSTATSSGPGEAMKHAPPFQSRGTTAYPFRRRGTSENFSHRRRRCRRCVATELTNLARERGCGGDRRDIDSPRRCRGLLGGTPQLAARLVEIGDVLDREFLTFVAHLRADFLEALRLSLGRGRARRGHPDHSCSVPKRSRSPGQARRRRRDWIRWTEIRSRVPGALFDHLGHQEEMILDGRRILDDVVGNLAVGHNIRALLHYHGRHGGHGLDANDVGLQQLLHESEHGIKLAPKVLDLIIPDRNARKMRDAPDGRNIDGHEAFPVVFTGRL